MLLGGRCAEELVFGSITTGASDDLRRVGDIAYAMVHEFAMGNGITSLRVAPEAMSEATRRVRDEEVRELADQAARAARAILGGHRHQLDELAATLLSNEVLERGDIEAIMNGIPHAAPERRGTRHLGIAAATAVNPARPGAAGHQ